MQKRMMKMSKKLNKSKNKKSKKSKKRKHESDDDDNDYIREETGVRSHKTSKVLTTSGLKAGDNLPDKLKSKIWRHKYIDLTRRFISISCNQYIQQSNF